jgi:hypothetical protein
VADLPLRLHQQPPGHVSKRPVTAAGTVAAMNRSAKGQGVRREGVVMNTSIETALKMLDEQGHKTISCSYNGQDWYRLLDCHVLLKPQEMEELGDGVYSFDELMELLCQRRLEEQGLL